MVFVKSRMPKGTLSLKQWELARDNRGDEHQLAIHSTPESAHPEALFFQNQSKRR